MATRIEDYYKEDEDSYKKRILKMGKMKTVEKTRKMKKVKTRKRDNFKSPPHRHPSVSEDNGSVPPSLST